MTDINGYPSPELLRYIKRYDIIKNSIEPLIKTILENWRYPEYARLNGNQLELHTVGWSGNEDIIAALMENEVFWMMCWVKSERGGHYYFELPKARK